MPISVFHICGLTMYPFVPRNQLREVYLIKGRTHYVANNPDEAVTCGTIKDVKWANEQCCEKLKIAFLRQYKLLFKIQS